MSDEQQEIPLTQETVQKLVAKTILEVQEQRDKFFDVFFNLNQLGDGDELVSMAETAIQVISRLKTVEVIVLTALAEFMKQQNTPEGSAKFLHYFTSDIVMSLLLLNDFVSIEELDLVYDRKELENPLNTFSAQMSDENGPQRASIHDLAEDLKTLLQKIKESKEDHSAK